MRVAEARQGLQGLIKGTRQGIGAMRWFTASWTVLKLFLILLRYPHICANVELPTGQSLSSWHVGSMKQEAGYPWRNMMYR